MLILCKLLFPNRLLPVLLFLQENTRFFIATSSEKNHRNALQVKVKMARVGFMRLWLFSLLLSLVMRVGLPGEEDLPPLRVGMELSYPPYEMVCADGKPCGISVDMAAFLGEFLGRKIEIENISFTGLIPSLNTGKVDLVISSLTENPERAKVIDFSEPYLTVGLSLLISAQSDLDTIEGANNSKRVIVVKSGTTGELYAHKHLTKATLHVLDKESLCVLEVIQNKADAFIYDQFSVATQWKKHPTTTRRLSQPFAIENWAIGIKKGNKVLLDQVNRFLKDFKEKEGIEKLREKYESPELRATNNG